jgi:Arc/MetJ family transcription regulator
MSVPTSTAIARRHTITFRTLTDTHEQAILTHGGLRVRTNIDIDDDLMREAMRASGDRTKRAVVERALRLLVQTRDQTRIRRLRGKVTWRGDLKESRRARGFASG